MIHYLATWFDADGEIIDETTISAANLAAALRMALHHIDAAPGAVAVHLDVSEEAA